MRLMPVTQNCICLSQPVSTTVLGPMRVKGVSKAFEDP